MSYRIQLAATMLAAASLFAACGGESQTPQPGSTPESKPALPSDVQEGLAAVGSQSVAEKESATTLAETGELVSPVHSELSAKFPGRVGQIFVDEGARVKKGQPLLTLETDYLKLELAQADAALARSRAAEEDAQRDFERKKDLLAKGSVAQALYDRTKATLDQAEAALAEAEAAQALAQQRLDDAVLVSPITGVVAERRTDVGERLGDNTVAFVVVQISPLKLRFRMPERYLASIKTGQVVHVRVDPYPDDVFEGKVTVVVHAIDTTTRTFVVEAEIPNRDERLKPGLFARVEMNLDRKPSS
jgi:membrane fusion protein, multidrug efflux system